MALRMCFLGRLVTKLLSKIFIQGGDESSSRTLRPQLMTNESSTCSMHEGVCVTKYLVHHPRTDNVMSTM